MSKITKQGWVKQFHNGSIEEGYDHLIDSNKASWLSGKLLDIDNVKIYDGNLFVGLSSGSQNTEWHQFDRYIVDSSVGKPKIILRVVQAKITKDCCNFFVFDEFSSSKFMYDKLTDNKWITLVYNTQSKIYDVLIRNKGEV